MNKQRVLGIVIVGLVVVGLWLRWPFAAFGDVVLFLDTPILESAARVAPADDAIVRYRLVRLNESALTPTTQELRLNLFNDAVVTAERLRVDRSAASGYVWVGRVIGVPDSLVSLSVSGDAMVGSVRLHGEERYTVTFAGRDDTAAIHAVNEIDPRRLLEPNGVDAIIPTPSATELSRLQSNAAATCEDGSVIDLMIVYTAEARDFAGGIEAMNTLANLRISEMNSANDDSRAGFDWRLVDVREISYSESGDLMTDLDRLRTVGDGAMDSVHAYRDAAKADLVNLIVATGTQGACGLAYQMNEMAPWFADYAFGVTALDYPEPFSCSSLTLAHEFGHGLGNAHDRANTTTQPLFPYSYGYQDPNAEFRTIMAYDCPNGGCPRINAWSNPDVSHNGLPTGVDYDVSPNEAADVARSMDQVSQTVANFQPNCSVVEPTATPTATSLPVDTPTPTEPAVTPSQTPVPTATQTPIPATATATALPTSTPTTMPTATPTNAATIAPITPPAGSPTPTVPLPTATQSVIGPIPFRFLLPLIVGP